MSPCARQQRNLTHALSSIDRFWTADRRRSTAVISARDVDVVPNDQLLLLNERLRVDAFRPASAHPFSCSPLTGRR